jgi:hypothetical protein
MSKSKPALNAALARQLKASLAREEQIVNTGWEAFIEVGLALKRIRDQELFRADGYNTFRHYCKKRWGYSTSTASRAISGALVGEEIKKAIPALQLNEAQVRELAPLVTKKKNGDLGCKSAVEVVVELVKGTPGHALTAKVIKSAVDEKLGRTAGNKPTASMTDSLAMSTILESIELTSQSIKRHDEVRIQGLHRVTENLLKLREWIATRLPDSLKALVPEYDVSGKQVIAFTGVHEPNGWLGNMAPYPVTYRGYVYKTSEALFQCLRFPEKGIGKDIRRAIRRNTSPLWAKKNVATLVKKNGLKLDLCDAADLRRMEQCLRLKLTHHPHLVADLLRTGDAVIIEDCSKRFGDIEIDGHAHGNCGGPFWGAALVDGIWRGQNMLGELWMKLRREYRAKQG